MCRFKFITRKEYKMASTTDNFNLDLYDTGDPANLSDQYNAAMRTIDNTLLTINNNASSALQKANKLETRLDTVAAQATAATDNLTALGITDITTAAASKTTWDNAASRAENNKNMFTALGVKTTDDASELKTTIANTDTKATRNAQIITQSTGFNDNIVVIGDSWVDGYYSGAKHKEASPANAIYDILRPTTKQTLGTSAGGFYASGDDGTFLDRWNAVTDKQHVDRVIIIGGQNDATVMQNNNVQLSSVDRSINTLLNTIRTDAPNAIIDIFPMCLAIGASMNRQNTKWSTAPDYRQQVYNLFAVKRYIPNVVIHEGAYRAGVWASRASDGGDGNDGAHLSKGGYTAVGYAMGNCILHDTTFFPTQSGYPNNSQINGTWNNVSIFETNGVLSIQYNVKCAGAQKNGDRLFQIAKQFSVGASMFYKDYSDKYFVSIDGNTLALQGVSNIQADDIIAGGIRLLAGF